MAGEAVGVLLIFSGVAPCGIQFQGDQKYQPHTGKRVSHIMVSVLAQAEWCLKTLHVLIMILGVCLPRSVMTDS